MVQQIDFVVWHQNLDFEPTLIYRKQPPLTWTFTTSSPVKNCVNLQLLSYNHPFKWVWQIISWYQRRRGTCLGNRTCTDLVYQEKEENFWSSDPMLKCILSWIEKKLIKSLIVLYKLRKEQIRVSCRMWNWSLKLSQQIFIVYQMPGILFSPFSFFFIFANLYVKGWLSVDHCEGASLLHTKSQPEADYLRHC